MITVSDQLKQAGADVGWVVFDPQAVEAGIVVRHQSGGLAIHWAASRRGDEQGQAGVLTTGPAVVWPSRFRIVNPAHIETLTPGLFSNKGAQ